MSRVLIDVTRLLYRRVTDTLPTGIDRVSLAYVRHYAVSARAVLSLGPFSAMLSRADSEAVFRAVWDAQSPARLLALRVVAKAFLWRWLAPVVRGDILLNTGHTGLESPHYGWSLRCRGARAFVVVHDLIPITHSRYCRSREPEIHRIRMRCAARISAGIMTNSRHTLDTFTAFCNESGLAVPKAIVAHLGTGLPEAAPAGRPVEGPYFVVLGTIEPRKNHLMLLRLWRRLAQTMGDAAPKLVVIGQRGWKCGDVVELLEHCPILKRVVVEHRRCSDGELVTWLHHAQALLLPSIAEGYGLPVTEALSRGVPVIVSELPVFRETVGDIPEYADPLDESRWEALIREYARSGSPAREAQIARIRSFRAATWGQHFALVDAMLES